MKSITRTLSTIAATATLLSATSALAASPFNIATRAYRGQLEGISGYQSLEQNFRIGKVSPGDIIRAAGETPTPELEQDVSSFLQNLTNDD